MFMDGRWRVFRHPRGRFFTMQARAHIVVHGIVQGVFFRYSTQREAEGLGLTGWVRNLPDGGVEMSAKVRQTPSRSWLRGPAAAPGAFVETADVSWEDHTGRFLTFEIRY